MTRLEKAILDRVKRPGIKERSVSKDQKARIEQISQDIELHLFSNFEADKKKYLSQYRNRAYKTIQKAKKK